MSLNLNVVMLAGRLTAVPELKVSQSGIYVTTVTVAVNRVTSSGENRAEFFDVVAWEKKAEFICRYFKKGTAIFVQGFLQKRSFDAKDGTKRYVTEIIATQVNFVESKDASAGSEGLQKSSPSVSPPMGANALQGDLGTSGNATPQGLDLSPVDSEDDLPF